ncbi:MAG: hypothetical protein HY787_05735 [Deltaproteobacteria bacterium]|nr:hypothetical protein [Deltaproteobacteria bacterium]
MSWDREIDELHTHSVLAHQMGGEEKIARQHKFGKLPIRERLDAILDQDTDLNWIPKMTEVGN